MFVLNLCIVDMYVHLNSATKGEAFRILVIAWDAFAKQGLAASFVNIEVDTETRSWLINFTKHFKVIYNSQWNFWILPILWNKCTLMFNFIVCAVVNKRRQKKVDRLNNCNKSLCNCWRTIKGRDLRSKILPSFLHWGCLLCSGANL